MVFNILQIFRYNWKGTSGQACKDINVAGTSQIKDESSPGSCQFGSGWLQISTEQKDKKDPIESFFHLWQYLSEALY